MGLNLRDILLVAGDTVAFVTKTNTAWLRMSNYAEEREAKDAEVNSQAQQAAASAKAAAQDAGAANTAKQQAESSALAAANSAKLAAKADGVLTQVQDLATAADASAKNAATSASDAAKANQIAIDNAQLAVDAAGVALAAQKQVSGSIGTAAQQAAAAAKSLLEQDMAGYIQQAQTAKTQAEEAAALAAQEAKGALAPEMTHYIQQAVAAKDGAVQAEAAANDSYATFSSDLTDLGVSWQNWSQQSALHEQKRTELTTAVNNAINELNKGIVSTGTKKTYFCIFGGTLNYQSAGVAGSDDFALVTRDSGADGMAYLHLDTGLLKNNAASLMCSYRIRGYNYGSNLNSDEQISAYLYYTGVHQQRCTDNGMAPFFYVASNNHFYLRLKIISQYFNQIIFDATTQAAPGGIASLKFTGGRITPLSIEVL